MYTTDDLKLSIVYTELSVSSILKHITSQIVILGAFVFNSRNCLYNNNNNNTSSHNLLCIICMEKADAMFHSDRLSHSRFISSNCL